VRRDLVSLMVGVFRNSIRSIADVYHNRLRILYIFITKSAGRGILAFVRYNSFMAGSIVGDVTGFERSRRYTSALSLNVVYLFYLPW
jgi:hypothetical protein